MKTTRSTVLQALGNGVDQWVIPPPDARAIVVAREEGTEEEFMMEVVTPMGRSLLPPSIPLTYSPTFPCPQYYRLSPAFLTLPAGLGSAASAVEPNKYRGVMGV